MARKINLTSNFSCEPRNYYADLELTPGYYNESDIKKA
jgi:hypothetical protein